MSIQGGLPGEHDDDDGEVDGGAQDKGRNSSHRLDEEPKTVHEEVGTHIKEKVFILFFFFLYILTDLVCLSD